MDFYHFGRPSIISTDIGKSYNVPLSLLTMLFVKEADFNEISAKTPMSYIALLGAILGMLIVDKLK